MEEYVRRGRYGYVKVRRSRRFGGPNYTRGFKSSITKPYSEWTEEDKRKDLEALRAHIKKMKAKPTMYNIRDWLVGHLWLVVREELKTGGEREKEFLIGQIWKAGPVYYAVAARDSWLLGEDTELMTLKTLKRLAVERDITFETSSGVCRYRLMDRRQHDEL